MAENPRVISKFDRDQGKPRAPFTKGAPGQPDPGIDTGSHGRFGATDGKHPHTSSQDDSRGAKNWGATHYHPNEHGRMLRGEHAVHPSEDGLHKRSPTQSGDSGMGEGEGHGEHGYESER